VSAVGLRRALPLVAFALGCHAPPDVTRTELRAYLARSERWAPVEAEAARTIERILRTEFVDEAEIRRQIADSRPRVLEHLQGLRAYTPQSDEVRRVHARYIEAWQKLLDGYQAIEEGFTTGDYTKLARGREGMMAWRDGIVSVAQELRQLRDDYGVEVGGAVESSARDVPQLATQRT